MQMTLELCAKLVTMLYLMQPIQYKLLSSADKILHLPWWCLWMGMLDRMQHLWLCCWVGHIHSWL